MMQQISESPLYSVPFHWRLSSSISSSQWLQGLQLGLVAASASAYQHKAEGGCGR